MSENEKMPLVPEENEKSLASKQAEKSLPSQAEQPAAEPQEGDSQAENPQDVQARGWFSSRKKIGALVVGLFLLFYITGITPVANVPLLRTLTQWMGYSQEETKTISFLGALFSWTDMSHTPEDELERDISAQRLADIQGDSPESQRQLDRLRLSSLFNLRSTNEELRAQGQRPDQITDVTAAPRDNEKISPVDVSATARAATQANNDVLQNDVFFGAEVSGAVARNKQDGFDSVKMLAKVKNPYQVGGDKADWMGEMADKAFWADSGLRGLVNLLPKGNTGGRISRGLLQSLGNSKATQDVYYAYLTSRAGNRTDNLWLKKTLASASFMGADLDRQMLSISGYGGITLDEDAVVADMDTIKLRILMDEKCKKTLKEGGDKVTTAAKELKQEVIKLNGDFPPNCGSVMGEGGQQFTGQINNTIARCREVNASYKTLGDDCQITYEQGTCDLENLVTIVGGFKTYCETEMQACESLTDPDERTACQGRVNTISRESPEVSDASGASIGELLESYAKGNFVSTPDWGKSLQGSFDSFKQGV